MKTRLLFALLGALCSGQIAVRLSAASVTSIKDAISALPLDTMVKDTLRKKLEDPDTLNEALDQLEKPAFGGSNGLSGVLTALNLRFKAFDTKGSGNGTALGLQYSYERALVKREYDASLGHPLSVAFSFHAKGDIAFDKAKNPNDFLDTGGSFNVFGSKGGFEPVVDADEWAKATQGLILQSAKFTGTASELDRSPEWQEFTGLVERRLSTQYFWRTTGHCSLESNQSFTSRQAVYGFQASGVIRAWNPDSAWAQFNVFDWPFACLRYLTGADRAFSPSGRAIPLVLVGIDQVDPTKNTARLAVDPDSSSYGRWRGEVSMKTHVAKIIDQDIWFIANYRIYDEISPSARIRAAHLDRFEYFAMGFEMKNGASFSYSTGKLPLDRKSDQVFDLGYKFKF